MSSNLINIVNDIFVTDDVDVLSDHHPLGINCSVCIKKSDEHTESYFVKTCWDDSSKLHYYNNTRLHLYNTPDFGCNSYGLMVML
jgi:hypothetical protein